MKKVLGAAVLAMALVGCGGPLEDDGTDVSGATRQELLKPDGRVGAQPSAPVLNELRDRQKDVVGAPAFQEQMHLTDPIHGGCR